MSTPMTSSLSGCRPHGMAERCVRLHSPGNAGEQRPVCLSVCRLWMQKQERAFTAWLNARLAPPKPPAEAAEAQALASKRAAARVRGILWRMYSADASTIGVMMRVEAKIDAGHIRMREEVWGRPDAARAGCMAPLVPMQPCPHNQGIQRKTRYAAADIPTRAVLPSSGRMRRTQRVGVPCLSIWTEVSVCLPVCLTATVKLAACVAGGRAPQSASHGRA
jgi:hypothetical protein